MPYFATPKKHSRLFEELILKSWWAILFFLLCIFSYDQAVQRKEREEDALRGKLEKLKIERAIALDQQEELQLQIESRHDPAWIEMVLKRRLGLVPEGQTKIYFKRS